MTGIALERLYRHRFSERERARKDAIWRVLCTYFFQRYVQPTDVVLDVACGLGEFSRHIRAGQIVAVDLNPDAANTLPAGARFLLGSAEKLDGIANETIDVAFASNFLEHMPSKAAVDAVLCEIRRVLRPGGRLILLQPNIKFAFREYWDFYDHHVALSHLSCVEALELAGFTATEVIDRFLPFSTKSGLPTHPLLVRAYLACRPAWRILGKQFLIVAKK